jgi:hypothetical protein
MTIKYTRKTFIQALTVFILLVVLPLLLYLVKNQQIFSPKATGGTSSLDFTGSNSGFVAGTPPTTSSQYVTLKLNYSSTTTGGNTYSQATYSSGNQTACGNLTSSVTPSSISRGYSVSFSASGFSPATNVQVDVVGPSFGVSNTLVSNSSGQIKATLKVSLTDLPGQYQLVSTGLCGTDPVTTSTSYTVIE